MESNISDLSMFNIFLEATQDFKIGGKERRQHARISKLCSRSVTCYAIWKVTSCLAYQVEFRVLR
jgi:hypothetical protein